MLPFAEENMPLQWRFQHDNDPKQTTKRVKQFSKEHKIEVRKWPAQSLDLNITENLVDDEIRKQHPEKFRTSNELFTELFDAVWNSTREEVAVN